VRVAFLPGTYRPDRCGVSHYTSRLMDELAARGVECVVLTSHEAAALHRQPAVTGATRGWGPWLLASLPGTIRRLDPDILHIQHAAGSFAFRRAVLWLPSVLRARGWTQPIVVTAHEYGWWQWQPPLLGWAWRRLGPWGEARELWDREDFTLLAGADAIIVTHQAAAETLTRRLPGLAPRVARVPIGPNIPVLVEDERGARCALRQRFGWEAEAQVISYFGFLHPVKGLETLLAAFRRVLDSEPSARLLLNGGAQSLALQGDQAWRYSEKLQALMRELGLESVARLTGYLPDDVLSQHLAGSDIGVLPLNGGVTAKSGSLLAMWAHGLPVVATAPPGRDRAVERAAWVVRPRDEEALAAGILRLLNDVPLRRALAAEARVAVADFSWAGIAQRHMAIYRRLLQAQPSARPILDGL
jgi:glycosyltransferase involved in cell wall biosynthesis